MNQKIQVNEDKSPKAIRPLWYQHLCGKKQFSRPKDRIGEQNSQKGTQRKAERRPIWEERVKLGEFCLCMGNCKGFTKKSEEAGAIVTLWTLKNTAEASIPNKASHC